MKKLGLSILLVTCILLTMLPMTAGAAVGSTITADITVGGAAVPCTFKVLTEPDGDTPGTVQIGNGLGVAIATTTVGELTIPPQISHEDKTYVITSIENAAFRNCSGLTGTLTIPDTVTTIGNYAFYLCSDLTGDLTIPDGIATIGDYAFNGCSGLTGTLTIPDTVTTLGDYAFNGCSGLTGTLTIPDTVTTLGNYAFYLCSGLTGTLTIPDTVTTIGDGAFYGCSGLTGTLIIPATVTTIGDGAFSGCSGLTGTLSIPDTVTTIGNRAFSGCSGFTGTLRIPAGVTSIEYDTFKGCSGLTGTLSIPDTVTTIGAEAFYGCSGLTGTLSIPDTVTTIGNRAFSGCSGFTALVLQGNSLPTTMGSDIFKDCTNLTQLVVPAAWSGGNSVTLSGKSTPFTTAVHGGLIKDAGLISVLGETLEVPTGGNGTTVETAITWPIDVVNTVNQVTLESIVPSGNVPVGNATANLYSNAGFDANEDAPIALTESGATLAYIKVTALDTGTVRYHAVTINRAAPPDITAAGVTITAPVVGTAPQDAAAVEAATANADYTVTGLVWNEPFTAGGKFTAGQVYTATVTLTSKNGKNFQAAAFTPTVAGAASVGTTTTDGGAVVGNTVSFTVTYPATGALELSNIAVTTQPTKLVYTETTDAVLSLNGLQVTETNNDGSTSVITFADGTAAGYTANPANGTSLTNAAHNGNPVVITHTASSQTASTDNLTVNPEPPSGYSVAIDQALIDNTNKTALSFSFSGAELGTTYNYTLSSSGGGTDVTGSGTIINAVQQITGIDVSGLADGTITLSVTLTDIAENTGAAATDTVSKDTANAAPTATVQPIIGSLRVSQLLTSHYTYSDAEGDLEGTSTYKWYRSDNAAGLNKAAIAEETSDTYRLQSADLGKYISFEVTPVASAGTLQGTSVESALTGPVAAAEHGTLSFSSATYSVAENGGSVTITVNRTGGSDGSVTVDYTTGDNTATAGSDFTAISGSLSFGDSETSKTFTVSILDDDVYEGDETVNLTLSNAVGGAVLGEPSLSVLTITDNEEAPVVNAATPVITTNLSTTQVQYNRNAAATALNVVASVSDAGSISYAWFSNTINSTVGATALGVTTATYTPSTATVGATYYYCVVTNTNAAVNGTTTAQTTSAIANIKVNATGGGSGGGDSDYSTPTVPAPVITVAEVDSKLFSNAEDIKVEADVSSAFGQSVTVKISDKTEAQEEIFSLTGADDRVYPFDISLYSKESGEEVQPKDGYSVKITMPVPEELLGDREKIKVVYGKDGRLETLKSTLTEKDGKWYITFEAIHFSPYALLVSKEQPATPWTNPFSDVKEGDWYYPAVQYAAQNGLMRGTGTNTFSPEITTSRGMIVTILHRLDGSAEALPSTFKDVNPNAYYAQGVAWAQMKGIVAGYGNGMFAPEESISREQLAAILWNYAGSPAVTDSTGLENFKDAGEISAYAKPALAWANQEGIINGMGGGLLEPKGNATRSQVAAIMRNFLEKTL